MKKTLANAIDICYPDKMSMREKCDYTVDDAEKYRQMILYAIKCGAGRSGIHKTKLAKEIYLADFIWFYENLESMSGMIYRKRKFGPLSDAFTTIIDEMVEEGIITCKEVQGTTDSSKTAKRYSIVDKSIVFDRLLETEKALIEQINSAWKSSATNAIIDFTHEQLPWKICQPAEVIPYSLITQEEPENIYGPIRRSV